MRISRSSMFTLALLLLSLPSVTAEDSWPQWRGASQNGAAKGESYPLAWSESSGVTWKTELPGSGGSTPVVQGSTAYLTAGVGSDETGQGGKNLLLAFDTSNGEPKWQVPIGSDRGNKHRKGSGSNPSAVIDGDSVFAYFRSGDLGCVDVEGNLRWQINLQDEFGEDTLWWDLGSSPTLTKSAIVVAVMQSGPSYLVALDKRSGDLLWKSDRTLDAPEEAAQSYATPLAVEVDGQEVIAVMGADHLTLHRASDGKELGRLGGFNPGQERYWRSISSPVAEGNIIVCPYARGDTLTAVRMDELASGRGRDAIAWFRDDLGSDVPTPAASGGRVYVVDDGKANKGMIHCLDIQTGKTLWQKQLPPSRITYCSSPLVAGDHLYVTAEDATTYVIGPLSGAQPDLVSVNELDDSELYTVASPVPLTDALLLRTRHHLYRLGSE